ncbi:hypothetical protein GMRT_15270 [Giardia muris]|uniref:Uncharacterized protein n=1 Tax=Giardia muris TaxID=5742 RepID=A0A4Z1SWH1_GIAMU|nr:hypothetical protein GMRT_15270 [Giardia muris]|eukprot:TNJ27878.1 hypothetical protein GMRT_15270 [Giardia muris]
MSQQLGAKLIMALKRIGDPDDRLLLEAADPARPLLSPCVQTLLFSLSSSRFSTSDRGPIIQLIEQLAEAGLREQSSPSPLAVWTWYHILHRIKRCSQPLRRLYARLREAELPSSLRPRAPRHALIFLELLCGAKDRGLQETYDEVSGSAFVEEVMQGLASLHQSVLMNFQREMGGSIGYCGEEVCEYILGLDQYSEKMEELIGLRMSLDLVKVLKYSARFLGTIIPIPAEVELFVNDIYPSAVRRLPRGVAHPVLALPFILVFTLHIRTDDERLKHDTLSYLLQALRGISPTQRLQYKPDELAGITYFEILYSRLDVSTQALMHLYLVCLCTLQLVPNSPELSLQEALQAGQDLTRLRRCPKRLLLELYSQVVRLYIWTASVTFQDEEKTFRLLDVSVDDPIDTQGKYVEWLDSLTISMDFHRLVVFDDRRCDRVSVMRSQSTIDLVGRIQRSLLLVRLGIEQLYTGTHMGNKYRHKRRVDCVREEALYSYILQGSA